MADPKDNSAVGDNRDGYQNGERGGEEQKEQLNFKDIGKSNAKEKAQKVAFYGNFSYIINERF